MTSCDCQTSRRHLALVEEAVDAVRDALRLFPEDERLREEERCCPTFRRESRERLAVLRRELERLDVKFAETVLERPPLLPLPDARVERDSVRTLLVADLRNRE